MEEIVDKILGNLIWDQNNFKINGNIKFGDSKINLIFYPSENNSLDLTIAQKAFIYFLENEIKIKLQISDFLLKIYNQNWNNDKLISKEEFISRIKIEAIHIFDDGSGSAYYQDGGLFWEHLIEVDFDSCFNIKDAYPAG